MKKLIQIIDCSYPNYWYFNKIGECYFVYDFGNNYDGYEVVNEDKKIDLFINKIDCIDVTRKKKLQKIKNRLYEKEREV